MLVVPARILGAEGSYGSEFKQYLHSLDKYLGGIQNYKNNIMLVINFAERRKGQLKIVINNIRNIMNHEDNLVDKYKDLL